MSAKIVTAHMADTNQSDPYGRREKHSLPGTNQAGKGPDSLEKSDDGVAPRGKEPKGTTPLDEHSLPGTNQAGNTAEEKRR